MRCSRDEGPRTTAPGVTAYMERSNSRRELVVEEIQRREETARCERSVSTDDELGNRGKQEMWGGGVYILSGCKANFF